MSIRNLALPAVAAFLALFATAASAHTSLVKSSPADKAQMAAPERLELQFSDTVQLKSLSLQQGTAAARTLTGLPEAWSDHFAVPLPALPAGDHVLRWSVATEDGHVAQGQIRFTVVPDAAHRHDHD